MICHACTSAGSAERLRIFQFAKQTLWFRSVGVLNSEVYVSGWQLLQRISFNIRFNVLLIYSVPVCVQMKGGINPCQEFTTQLFFRLFQVSVLQELKHGLE